MNIRFFSSLWVLALSFNAAAQPSSDSLRTRTLPPVTVTASRLEQSVFETGRSVSVVDLGMVQTAGAQLLGNQLNQLPGFFVPGALQVPGSLQFATLRGSSALHQVTMIDGIRYSDPTSVDQAMDLSEISLPGSGRLEVVRGTHSTLYGSQAIGGVINLISPLPDEGWHGIVQSRGGQTTGTFSGLTSGMAQLSFAAKSGWFAETASSVQNSRGFNATVDTTTGNFRLGNRADGFSKRDGRVRAGFNGTRWKAHIGLRSHYQELDLDDGAFRDDDNHTSRVNRNAGTLSITFSPSAHFFAAYKGSYQTFFRNIDDLPTQTPGGSDYATFTSRNTGSSFNHDFQTTFQLSGITLTGGLFWQTDAMNIRTLYVSTGEFPFTSTGNLSDAGPEATAKGAFLYSEVKGSVFTERFSGFSIAGGLRLNNHSLSGSLVTYDVNPVYRISGTLTAFVNASSGFSAPSLYRLYANDQDFISGITRGNKNLKAETSKSVETGLKYRPSTSLELTASVFRTRVYQLIDYVYLWNPSPTVSELTLSDYRGDTYLNLGTQTNRGLELSLRKNWSDRWTLEMDVSLLESRLAADGNGIDTMKTAGNKVQLYAGGAFLSEGSVNIPLTRRPSTARIATEFSPDKKWNIGLSAMYWSGRKDGFYDVSLSGPFGALGAADMKPYFLIDLQVYHSFSDGLAVYSSVENLLATSFSDIQGYTGRPRTVLAGLNYRF